MVTRQVEDTTGNLELQLKSKTDNFNVFLALDESCDVRGTAQLLIFIKGMHKDFEITEELNSMQLVKGTITGNNLFVEVNRKSCKKTCKRTTVGKVSQSYN